MMAAAMSPSAPQESHIVSGLMLKIAIPAAGPNIMAIEKVRLSAPM